MQVSKETPDIIFLNPPLRPQERYGKFAGIGSYFPPLGLCFLASICEREGFHTKIIDAEAKQLGFEDCVKKILESSPRFVGITATTLSIYNAARIAEILKRENPKIINIIGGVHVTSLAQETMRRFPDFDIGVIGEGEEVIIKLLHCLMDDGNLDKIEGIIYRENDQLHVHKNNFFIHNLDTLPKLRLDLLEDFPGLYSPPLFSANRTPAAMLVTSRGCPGKCTFCDRSVFGSHLRFFSAEYLIEQINELIDIYRIKEILFYDDTFVVHKKRLYQFCNYLITHKLKLTWTCMARVDSLNFEELRLMSKAGCWQIGYGIESGSKEILEDLNKNITLDEIRRVLEWTKKAGISTKGYLMLASPKETMDTFNETLRFINELPLDNIHVSFFTPFPGSQIYNELKNSKQFTEDWTKMSQWNPIYIPTGLRNVDMIFLLKKMVRSFYFRSTISLKYLLKFFKRPILTFRYLKGIIIVLISLLKKE